jgi:hypothetical protein
VLVVVVVVVPVWEPFPPPEAARAIPAMAATAPSPTAVVLPTATDPALSPATSPGSAAKGELVLNKAIRKIPAVMYFFMRPSGDCKTILVSGLVNSGVQHHRPSRLFWRQGTIILSGSDVIIFLKFNFRKNLTLIFYYMRINTLIISDKS